MIADAKAKLIRAVKVAQYEELIKGSDASEFWKAARDLGFAVAEANDDLLECVIDKTKCLLEIETIEEEAIESIYFNAFVEVN